MNNVHYLLFVITLCILPFTVHSSIRIDHVTVIDVVNKRILYDQQIRIENGKIVFLGDQPAVSLPATTVINGSGKIAMPGFVNTHTHLWQHIARGYYPGGTLQEWIRIYRVAHYMTPEELFNVILAASHHALLSGITTVSDFSSMNFTDDALNTVCNAMKTSGLDGAVMYWYPAAFMPDAMKEAQIRHLRKKYDPGIQIWMGQGPLSFFSLPSVYSGIQLAGRLKMPLSEHLMENVREQQDFHQNLNKYVDRYGDRLHPDDKAFLDKLLRNGPPSAVSAMEMLRRTAAQTLKVNAETLSETEKDRLKTLAGTINYSSPVPLLDYLGALKNFISIHSVWTLPEDMKHFKKEGNHVYVSHNPESNMYLASGIAPIMEYLNAGIPVTLGTDGAASNDGIDFFSAMRAYWNLQKLNYLDTRAIRSLGAWEILRSATIHGAEALGISDSTGSITEGKEADLFLLDPASLGMSPLTDSNLLPLIIYSAGPRDVDHVISNGQLVVENGELVRFDEGRLAENLSTASENAHRRVATGKTVTFSPSIESGQHILKYFSVRPKDSVHIMLENRLRGRKRLRARIFFSGTTFGGTVPSLMHPEATTRFPQDDPAGFRKLEITLKRKDKLTITKAKDDLNYTIVLPNGKIINRKGVTREQLLIMLEE